MLLFVDTLWHREQLILCIIDVMTFSAFGV